MIVDVVTEALEHVLPGETVVLHLVQDLIINLQVVVMLIVQIVPFLLGLRAILTHQVLVKNVVLGDNLLLKAFLVF